MPKRSWNQVDGAATQPIRRGANKTSTADIHIKSGSPSSPDDVKVNFSHPPTPTLTDAGSEPRSAKSGSRQRAASTHSDDNEQIAWPSITRKVKACAACRKQKIKCDMDDDHPPCKRCKERGLSCKLNKSLQTLIDEESRWRKTVSHDLTIMHSALEETLRALSLPALPSLHTPLPELGSLQEPEAPITHTTTESITARDPEISSQLQPAQETSSHIPIESLYELTRLRSLRGETVEEQPSNHDDFISRGLVPVDEAEKLFHFYQTQLDPYIYGLASKYKTLENLRRSSSLLTACICTVAASHQAGNGQLYETCNQEFRRLVSGSMFERRISLDYLPGLAVRRASDINLHKFYYRIIDSANGFAQTPDSWDPSDPEASIDPVRLWYLLYICDQHLSILYTRAPMIREDDTIRGWRAYLESPHASQSDIRISSQVALMTLLSQIREFFGVDASKSIPRGAMPHINTFSHHLDKWLAHWSSKLRPNEHIGNFPSKGVLLHYHFGKLHLYSHVFRGLKSGDHIEHIPSYFKDAASTAVSHATTILELLLGDADIRRSIIGVPHYFHTMVAFACVVLLKVVDRYRDDLGIDVATTHALIQRVIDFFRHVNCGQYHLVHWMADGLAKMLVQSSCAQSSRGSTSSGSINGSINGSVNSSSHSNVPLSWDNTHSHTNNQNGGSRGINTMSPSIVHHDSVDNTLFNSVSEIPEQPSFLSLDPRFGNFNAEDDDNAMMVGGSGVGAGMGGGAGTFLPMLDGIEGGDYGLTDLSFNFV
ncbi:Hypothetical protein PENO1_070490 [Penicillium occitanis (nom. inval.)]|nr:hypothetical protein PENOC_096730 [Penicillium occitanis (nom. inval.)]PCG96015.1 Hypothetical protein PENO1_070490 [Penicillium occitanis (nom. inval.)]